MCLNIFLCTFWPSICLLCRNVYLGLLCICGLDCLDFLILSCKSCLFILEINSFSVALFANIFSQSVGSLFILLISFAVVFSLIRSREGNGNPPSTIAWKIPWTEEPDGLQSMVLQKAGLRPSVHTHAHTQGLDNKNILNEWAREHKKLCNQ